MADDLDPDDLHPDDRDPSQVPELDAFGRDAFGRRPADWAVEGDDADDLIPLPPMHSADGRRLSDLPQDPALAAEILAATADLDDDSDAELIPASAPLTIEVVEGILNSRRPETQISPTRDRMQSLMDALGHPERAYPVVQIGGTNGKTSVTRMIDALLTRVGVRTGRFTSPHLQSVVERICLDNEPISHERYVEAYSDISPYVDLVDAASQAAGGIAMSKFEILTGMAFALFADAPVDAGVFEVGLGGTWDSTNVADATVAAICPVGLDHTDFLGDTVAEIAAVKAGIIKPGTTVVIGRQPPEAMTALLQRAVEVDATVARFGAEFTVLQREFAVGGQRLTLQGLGGVYEDVFLPLSGEHQAENAALALAAVEAFFGAGAGRQLDVEAIQDGFASVSSPGRLERIKVGVTGVDGMPTGPTIMIDAAHNPHGAAALAKALAEEFSFSRLVGVIAVLADKDVRGVLQALSGSFDEVVVTVNSSPRSMPVAELAELAVEVFGEDRVHTADRMDAALALAVDLADAGNDDDRELVGSAGTGVLVTGSVVSAGDARALAGLRPA